MKFTKNWLLDYLEISLPFNDILDGLLKLGLEVEQVIDYNEKLKNFSVAEILNTKKHPNADKLQICKVNTKDGIQEIVCGAPNARKNIKVIFAGLNSYIPGSNITIRKVEIRGIISCGMMLSEMELGISKNHSSIIEINEQFKVGESASKALGLNDTLIEVTVTPNLGHLLSVRAIAKALSALGLGIFKEKEYPNLIKHIWSKTNSSNEWNYFDSYKNYKENQNDSSKLEAPNIEIALNSNIIENIALTKITNVNNKGKTPPLIQNRLKLIGQNLISPLVDITNYLTIDINHPMHVYNADTLENNFIVDYGTQEDSLLGLDNKEYKNLSNIALIKSNNKVIALAGVIGSKDYSITENSTSLILECAYFPKQEVSKTSQQLGINTTSSYHFQRGVNPLDLIYATNKALNLIKDACGGIIENIYLINNHNKVSKSIKTSFSYINSLLGNNLTKENIINILKKQNFTIKQNNNEIIVEVPIFRNDIEQECDIVDIILKSFGIENIKPKNINTNFNYQSLEENSLKLSFLVKKSLANFNLLESINMSFISKKLANLFNIYNKDLELINPISSEFSVMRGSLIPSLVSVVTNNTRLGYSDLRIFEVANIYHNIQDSSLNVAAILSGFKHKKDWNNKNQLYNTFDSKELLYKLIDSLGVNPTKFKIITNNLPIYYHPNKSATLLLGKNILAYFGELHPKLTEFFNLKNNPAIFELSLNILPLPKNKFPLTIKELPTQMPLERDFAFIFNNNVTAEQVIKLVANINKQLITEVKIFDIFKYKDKNNISIAFSVILTPKYTLKEEEINNLSKQIINTITANLGGILRDKLI